jgi:SAM-dependent methyltransferase
MDRVDELTDADASGGTPRPSATDIDVLSELVAVDGLATVDIGCGDGGLVRWLTAHGAHAIGIEISDRALVRARGADPEHAPDYLVGSAQSLPLADASVDLAIFWRSLHHVPAAMMASALRETRRVLRAGGLAYIAEPLAEGGYFELLSAVDEETEVRKLAQDAIAAAPGVGLARERTVEYEITIQIADFAELRDRVVAVDPERGAAFDALSGELLVAAQTLGEAAGEGWRFRQPMRVDVLRRAS